MNGNGETFGLKTVFRAIYEFSQSRYVKRVLKVRCWHHVAMEIFAIQKSKYQEVPMAMWVLVTTR